MFAGAAFDAQIAPGVHELAPLTVCDARPFTVMPSKMLKSTFW